MVGYPNSRQLRAEDRVRPGNLYGATKAWSEALGSWVASASTTTVVVLRIGFCLEHPPSGPETTPLDMAMWLSYGDAARLVVAAAAAPAVEYFVGNGISANRFQRLDLESTRAALGYEPLDDAWTLADPGPTAVADGSRGRPWRKRRGSPREHGR
ncbi:MAG: hypothetical protein ACRDZ8_19470 [Acidimicrobiales bacterium]